MKSTTDMDRFLRQTKIGDLMVFWHMNPNQGLYAKLLIHHIETTTASTPPLLLNSLEREIQRIGTVKGARRPMCQYWEAVYDHDTDQVEVYAIGRDRLPTGKHPKLCTIARFRTPASTDKVD